MAGFFSGYRVKKRTFVVAGLALLSSLLVAVMVAWYASSLLGPDVLLRFQLREDLHTTLLPGSGINLTSTASSNLLMDGSFEPVAIRHYLTAYSGDEQSLTVSSEQAGYDLYNDGFFIGAQTRVMEQTAEGLRLKKHGTVIAYGLNHVGMFQSVRLPADLPPGNGMNALISADDQTILAAGASGLVMTIEGNQVTAVADAEITGNLTDISRSGKEYIACSDRGEIVHSTDGLVWRSWETSTSGRLNAIAADDNGFIAAVGTNGQIMSGSDGYLGRTSAGTVANLKDIIWTSEGWYAVGASGIILYSSNGIVWHNISLTDHKGTWNKIIEADAMLIVIGDNGSLARIRDKDQVELIAAVDNTAQIDFVDLIILSRHQYIALDRDGSFYVSHDGGNSWSLSETAGQIKPHAMIFSGKDKIISASADGQLGLSQLVANIKLDSPLQEGRFQAGDLLYLEMDYSMLNFADSPQLSPRQTETDSVWDFSEGVLVKRESSLDLPGQGKGYLRISSDQPIQISQNINSSVFFNQNEGSVFRFSCLVRQESAASSDEQTMQVSLTGLNQPVQTSFSISGTDWKRYSYSFIIPRAWADESGAIDFEISFPAGGTVMLDDLSLTAASETETAYGELFVKTIKALSPGVMRLENVPMGRVWAAQTAWAMEEGQDIRSLNRQGWLINREPSLSAAMHLAQKSGADPWLVIDSFAGDAEIEKLIEYLAAPVSEQYGRLRLDQGSAVPWTDTFRRIYIEICDDNHLFDDDRLRANYVDWVISQISLSPYFVSIKNQIVFVDGMVYKQGIMQSSADYHATDLQTLRIADSIEALEEIYTPYRQQIPRNPAKSTQDWPEIARSAAVIAAGPADSANMAAQTATLLYDIGEQTNVIMADIDASVLSSGSNNSVRLAVARLISDFASGHPVGIESLSASDSVFVKAVRQDDRLITVICNLGDLPVTCQLVAETDLKGAIITKYDNEARRIGSEKMRRNESPITVLPGGVVYLESLDS